MPENHVPDMFYKVKAAYERILYLQNYSSERVSELTRSQGQLIRDKRVFAPKAAASKASVPKGRGQLVTDLTVNCCMGENEHCPAWLPQGQDGSRDTDLDRHWRERVKHNDKDRD